MDERSDPEMGGPEAPVTMNVTRTLLTQSKLTNLYGKDEQRETIKQRIRNSMECSASCFQRQFLSYLPMIDVLRTYKLREYILGDVLGGVSAAFLHFPQGLAFGILSSLAPQFGLYNSFFPVLVYMLFGTSPHTSFGTNAVIALFTAEMVEARVQGFTGHASVSNITAFDNKTSVTDAGDLESEILMMKVATASSATFVVGIILLLMGIFRLGFLTSYLSSSFIHAFVCACAFHIGSSQIPKALGITIPPLVGAGKMVKLYIEVFKAIPSVNIASFIISVISIIVLILVKDCVNERFKDKMKMPVPIDLLLIVVSTIISHFANFKDNFSVEVVGKIPSGIPAPDFPEFSEPGSFIGTSIIVAFLVFVLTISMAKICETKHGYTINDNQELVAYGMANFISSLFYCFPSCVAPPRTMILSAMGVKTTLNGLFTSVVMLLVLLVLGQLFGSLPLPVLSVMVIVAVKDLIMHVKEIPTFWRTNRYDFVIWIGTLCCGVFVDVPYALYAGIVLGFLTVIVQSQRSRGHGMGKLDGQDRFLNTSSYLNLKENGRVRVFRMEYSLYFATATQFQKELFTEMGDPRNVVRNDEKNQQNGKDMKENNDQATDENVALNQINKNDCVDNNAPSYIVLDCSAVNYVDMNGMKTIAHVTKSYKKVDIIVLFARCSDSMLHGFTTGILKDVITENHVFPEVLDAVFAVNNGHV